jgi:hypothetical protein
MRRSADILSLVSVLAAMFALSVTQFAFPPVGFEGMIAVAGLSSWLSVLSCFIAFVLCAVLVARHARPKPWRPALGSAGAQFVCLPSQVGFRKPRASNGA